MRFRPGMRQRESPAAIQNQSEEKGLNVAVTSSSSKLIRTSRRALSYTGELEAHRYSQVALDTIGPDHASQLWLKDGTLHPPTCHPHPRSHQQSKVSPPKQARQWPCQYHVRYTGREYDPDLNLYHFRARWYDPSTGGFISRDPLGYVDGMSLYRGYFGVAELDAEGTLLRVIGDIIPSRNPWNQILGVGNLLLPKNLIANANVRLIRFAPAQLVQNAAYLKKQASLRSGMRQRWPFVRTNAPAKTQQLDCFRPVLLRQHALAD